MKIKLFFLLTLAITASSSSEGVDYHYVSPTNRDAPVSVRVTVDEIGDRFIVFYRTNSTTLDKFLDSRLAVCSEDDQIASTSLKKNWKPDGVEFEFSIS